MAKKKFTGNATKYTESELLDRYVGDPVPSHGRSATGVDRWLPKKAAYTNEGVWSNYTVLRDSFRSLLVKYDGFIQSKLAHTCAQIMIDTFLIRRSRGEKVVPPREVVPINAVPGSKDGLALFEAEEFVGAKTITENEKIRWVAENIQRAGITPATAISEGAYYMLLHYRETKQRQEDFFKTVLPKLLTKEGEDKGGKLTDDGKETIDLIDRLIAALPEVE